MYVTPADHVLYSTCLSVRLSATCYQRLIILSGFHETLFRNSFRKIVSRKKRVFENPYTFFGVVNGLK